MKPIKRKSDPTRKVVHNIPPNNGFGSEEDSLLNVYYLRPEVAVRKIVDTFKKDKHILRFVGKLVSQSEIESERHFVFSFFLADDTLQIFEEATKNSGRISARFMERRKVVNPITNQYYVLKEFYEGATIYINKYIFKLSKCDEKTKYYMKDNCETFRDSDISKIINRIRKEANAFNTFNDFLIVLISKIDPNNVGHVSEQDILKGLAS